MLGNSNGSGSGRSTGNSMKDVVMKDEEIDKLKKVNNNLLVEIKELRMQSERRNDRNLENSRVL